MLFGTNEAEILLRFGHPADDDMVTSNMLTNFKGEQMEIMTCEERLSEVGLFSQKTGESRTM